MGLTALVFGGTGLTGKQLISQLQTEEKIEVIKVFNRRKVDYHASKVQEIILDYDALEQYATAIKGDLLFCCIGTTRKKTPNDDAYKAIDYGIPTRLSALAKQNHIPTFAVISSIGANQDSRFFYNRIKGEMERDVLKQNLPNTYIFRPSVLVGPRTEKRFAERASAALMNVLHLVFKDLILKYKPVDTALLAKKMIQVSLNGYDKNIIESDEIQRL
ncbi:MAG: NAD(P)H-binding protein [Flavobacterium sp.]|nr:NAD(P)H-binding protein [Candidatus Neoflavobacterium equi]